MIETLAQKRRPVWLELLKKYGYIPAFFISLLIMDFGLRRAYNWLGSTPLFDTAPILFTIGWSALLTAVAVALPRKIKRVYLSVVIVLNAALSIVHSLLYNIFGNFFSFSDMAFAGNGIKFLEREYIRLSRTVIVCVLISLAALVFMIVHTPKEKYTRHRIIGAALGAAAGIGLIWGAHALVTKDGDEIRWEIGRTAIYEDFTNLKECLNLTGLYHYTARDFFISFDLMSVFSNTLGDDLKELDAYFAAKAPKKSNEMTGIFAGKNLFLIQLESIDDWMLTKEYMPNLYALKEKSLDFQNHYSAVYISAGTFNTEFIANTGLLPGMSGISSRVYTKNHYPNSLPRLFIDEGYTARSYHQSDGSIYNRGNIHLNLGYQSYTSGEDMGVSDIMLDTELMKAYESMTANDRFFNFIITISGHGPYSDSSIVSRLHMEKALEIADTGELSGQNREVFVHAVAHAIETDEFIGQLVKRLESDGLLDNTVLVFYADHYNYYVMNDALIQIIKGVEDKNMSQRTVFFAYSPGIEPRKIDKVTSGLDILPTLANLFGFDVDYRYYMGNDTFDEDEGGYVVFADGSWYDGRLYRKYNDIIDDNYVIMMDEITAQDVKITQKILKTDYFSHRLR
ncbi:MAG TPA: LTA synthase family protein [Clostridiales bacterium]|nr:LTA synthase family protein [Clostridiales bacterium]